MRLLAFGLSACLLAGAAQTGPARSADRPTVVELFTSEGCSSCPPADAILTELARGRPDVLALGFHVTYWNHLGWRDPFSLQLATDRQAAYATRRSDTTVYTPNIVVDGDESLVGSESASVLAAIGRARGRQTTVATIEATRAGGEVVVTVGAGRGRGTLVLVGYDREHRTAVPRGENKGRTLLESNVVRSARTVGSWAGAPLSLRLEAPAGEAGAVLLQDAGGRIVGAARISGGSP